MAPRTRNTSKHSDKLHALGKGTRKKQTPVANQDSTRSTRSRNIHIYMHNYTRDQYLKLQEYLKEHQDRLVYAITASTKDDLNTYIIFKNQVSIPQVWKQLPKATSVSSAKNVKFKMNCIRGSTIMSYHDVGKKPY